MCIGREAKMVKSASHMQAVGPWMPCWCARLPLDSSQISFPYLTNGQYQPISLAVTENLGNVLGSGQVMMTETMEEDAYRANKDHLFV